MKVVSTIKDYVIETRTKSGKREDFKRDLFDLIEIMRKEPAFVRTIAHDHPDDDGVWTTVLWTAVDRQDRRAPRRAST